VTGAQYTVNNDPKTMFTRCETLMLDMDGTVLDLAYDNYVWKELVPEHYAKVTGIDIDDARTRLFAKYHEIQGDIRWYCLDHWSERLGLDVLELHRGVNQRIGYLPGAKSFLEALRERNVRVLLVTNSHPDTLALKDEVTGLAGYFDAIYTSHQFGFAKERDDAVRGRQPGRAEEREHLRPGNAGRDQPAGYHGASQGNVGLHRSDGHRRAAEFLGARLGVRSRFGNRSYLRRLGRLLLRPRR
jgi:phosphoglycolate phosphatase-like HAD superfamily hydrolase